MGNFAPTLSRHLVCYTGNRNGSNMGLEKVQLADLMEYHANRRIVFPFIIGITTSTDISGLKAGTNPQF